ncbi:GNAT family N-acetyltransferase, partial [bacterium]|nr:GNAT family N-acetyltransferase [bacterium]
YLAEPRYELVVALEGDLVVGMVTGFTYFHPDKIDEFYINECGVGDDYLRRGIATKMMEMMFARAKTLGCEYCWLGTELDNVEANALYNKLGGEVSKMNFFEFEWD